MYIFYFTNINIDIIIIKISKLTVNEVQFSDLLKSSVSDI